MKLRIGLGLLLCLSVCSCVAVQPTPPTSEPSTTVPPSQTATTAATHTATPAATAQAPLSPDGPWAVILNQDGIWAVNEDGSGLTHLAQDVVLHRAISVAGGWIAYVTDAQAEPDAEAGGGLLLRVLSLPEGGARTVTELQIPDVTSDSSDDLQFAAQQVYRAVVFQEGGLAWSPAGGQLAFVSGHDGTSADVYVYARDTGEIIRLTDGPSHAYQLSWSPDGQYIFHTGTSNFGSGAGHTMVGVWTARADGTGIQSLYEPDSRSGDEELIDWVSNDTVLVHSWRPDCGKVNLVTANVVSGEVQIVWPDYFNRAAYNPATDTILIDAYDIECNPADASGFYRVEPGGAEREQVSGEEYDAQLPEQAPDPVPVTLKQHLETVLAVESMLWVQP